MKEEKEEEDTNFGFQGCTATKGRQPKIRFPNDYLLGTKHDHIWAKKICLWEHICLLKQSTRKKSNFINGTDTFPVWNIHALLLETAAFHSGTFFFKNKPETRFKLWPRVCFDTARQTRYTPLYHKYYTKYLSKD